MAAIKDLVRIVSAGSVDDGKSTLLGRILADTRSVPDDQLATALEESRKRGHDGLDPSLLLDGLEAERAQGITIDVAYRYFSTDKRAFVLADAPGHARYTRNMATGAAGCDVALLLVDAERGVFPQTRRHAYVAVMMGVRHLVVAVNKMDRVGWSREIFERIEEEIRDLVVRLDVSDLTFVPVSALAGDNVVKRSDAAPWYSGAPLLAKLESMHVASDRNLVDMRLPVQLVLPSVEERRLTGTMAAGVLRKGEDVMVLPSTERAKVLELDTPNGPATEVFAGQAVSLTLDKDIDVARGDVLVHLGNRPRVGTAFEATLVWMDEAPLALERSYLLRLGMRWVTARIAGVRHRVDVETGHRVDAPQVELNDIARVRIETDEVLVFDEFRRVRELGSFILVDRDTHTTCAAGTVIERGSVESKRGDAKVVWLPGPSGPERAAQLAAGLAGKRQVLRLDTSALEAIVGPAGAPEFLPRTLACVRLMSSTGCVPLVLHDEHPMGQRDVLVVEEDEAVAEAQARFE